MALPLVIVLTGVLLVLQLILCFKAERRWLRLAPLLLTALADIACWILYFAGAYSEVYGAAFAFYIYGIVLTLILAAELLAWGVYAVVKYVQKRRK